MKPNSIKKIAEGVKGYVSKYSPEILTGLGIAGMVTTTVLAVKATPKALQLIEEKKKEEEVEKLTVVDTVKTTWKCYVPAVITGTVSTVCLIGATSVNTRRTAALATAYKISETALAEYREAVVETIGEEKEREVAETHAKKQIEKVYIEPSEYLAATDRGEVLWWDYYSSRPIYTTRNKIDAAVNKANNKLYNDSENFVSLNEFYEYLGMPTTGLGDDIGWYKWKGDSIELEEHYLHETPDGKPCFMLIFYQHPYRAE